MYNYSNVSLISRNLCKFLLCLCTLYCLNQNIAKIITAARLNAWHTRARHDSLWRRHVFRRTLNGHVYLGGLGSCLPATKPDSLSRGHNKVGLVRGGHNAPRGAQCPRTKSLWEPKSPNNVANTFFNTGYYLLPKDRRFEHGGAKLVSFPGRHLTSVCPWFKFQTEARLVIGSHLFSLLANLQT